MLHCYLKSTTFFTLSHNLPITFCLVADTDNDLDEREEGIDYDDTLMPGQSKFICESSANMYSGFSTWNSKEDVF